MGYHIPSDEKIIKAVTKVLKKYRTVSSQHRLKELVENELKTKNDEFHVSGSRIRNLVLKSDLVRIEIHSREGSPDKVLHRCPVCNNSLKKVKNQTIFGGEVTIEFRCSNCGYWTGKKKRIPTLYVFHFKK